ncbi:TetR family transcriptional regulator [Nocardioides gansuensis]|uniref:TetR family transcriptional regulator n=1 Tax=Nocardioides gansuensis TaxID=2138300 RepID=A0A2T8F8A7_9ACTN|nr:TetR/AcrR family transcriptional regulator [Nocardioides gansuensis]PVG81958.1 TetR family transcriptional regulator [Nocardioides gansuensis]
MSGPEGASLPTSRRQQIIEVAAGLFAERGFHGVSIYDLGAAMGTSGAALYKHFASKDALLGAMLVDISERLLSEGQQRADAAAEEGPDVVLAALIAWHVEFALTHPALITVQLRDLASLSEEDRKTVRRLQRRYVELWVDAVSAAVGADEAHARSAAHAVFGMINSTPHSALLGRDDMAGQLQRMAHAALHACRS